MSLVAEHPALGGADALGLTLRRLRTERGMSQDELGRRSGLSENHVGVIERGELQSPGLCCAGRLARALEVSPAALAVAFLRPPGSAVPLAWLERERKVAAAAGDHAAHGAGAMGQALIRLRDRARLSQVQLARHAGVTRMTLRSIESGRTADPLLLTVAHLAHGLTRGHMNPDLLDRLAAYLVLTFGAGAA